MPEELTTNSVKVPISQVQELPQFREAEGLSSPQELWKKSQYF